MENEKNVILKIENLTKKFGGLVAVNEVNIHLNEGEILGVIGANGAGKTTVFNMVSGSFHPTSGKIIFNGKEIQNMQAHEICKQGIGRTYQVVKPFGALTLRENVMVGAMMRHPNVKEAGEIADKIIHKLIRGVTYLEGEGAYSHRDTKVILTVVKSHQLADLKQLVVDIDPDAFVIVQEAHQVLGDGFARYTKDSL